MYRLTKDAQEDLNNIRHYTVKNWGNQQSGKYLAELQQTMQLLSETPEIGKKRPDVSESTVSFPHASHAIYYLMEEEHILIFAVLHKSCVPNIHLDDRV